MADPLPLAMYKNVQQKYDADLRKVLERAARNIRDRIAQLPVGIGGDIRRAQLRLVLDEIRLVQRVMWTKSVSDVVTGGRKAAAEAAEDALETLTRVVYAALPESVAKTVSDGLRAAARAGIDRDFARVPRMLSARVYRDFALSSGKIEEMIRSGTVAGLSARELAADVYSFISPTTPGGASYAAMRLARTEINNSFHEQQIKGGQRPGVLAVKWNLSGSHPKPDECNQFAGQNSFNLGGGMYRPDSVPGKPHPQCLCFLTYKTMDPKQFANALKRGDFDTELDRRIRENLNRSVPT